MDNDLIKKVVFDLTLEVVRLKEELERTQSRENMWFTKYMKMEDEINAIKAATTACVAETQAETE